MLLAALLAAAVATPPAAASVKLNAAERQVIKLINAERSKRGLVPVRARVALNRAADRHSRDMLRRNYFAHRAPGGATVGTRSLRSGYARSGCTSWRVGEVLARGRGLAATPRVVVMRWMNSKRHRAVLLSPRWRDIGVGRRSGTFRGIKKTVMTTVEFGRRIR